MGEVSGVPGMTRSGIVFDLDSPAGAAMAAHEPARQAIRDLSRGGSTQRAEAALANLEDAVRGLPAGLAERYEPTLRELRAAIAHSQVDRARVARGPQQDPIRNAMRRPGRFARSMLADARRSPVALRQLSRISADDLVARLERNGLTHDQAQQQVDTLREGLGRLVHDQVAAAGRREMRHAERELRNAAVGLGSTFERFAEMLTDGRSGELLERLRLGGAETPVRQIRELMDITMRDPSRRAELEPRMRSLLQAALSANEAAVAAYNDSPNAFNADFGDAYRAFPSTLRAVARRSGIDLAGEGGGLLGDAVRAHIEHGEHEHHAAHLAGHIAAGVVVVFAGIAFGVLGLLTTATVQGSAISDRRTAATEEQARVAGGTLDTTTAREQSARSTSRDAVSVAAVGLAVPGAVGSIGAIGHGGHTTAEVAREAVLELATEAGVIIADETLASE